MGNNVTTTAPEFAPFPKMARFSRGCVITEKIDGTNAQVFIGDDGAFAVGSRNRWITPQADNYGFARWAYERREELMKLGPGRHFGEWWGLGIQRGYGLHERRFSLFNAPRWKDDPNRPACCSVVPILAAGVFTDEIVSTALERLRTLGSVAAPGFMKPEGLIVYHVAAGIGFKKTLEHDESPKSALPLAA